ncbi:MAG: CsgG/HfaB family protein [Candidatus Vogelbacteria bacterium]
MSPSLWGASGVTADISAPGGEKVINPGEQIGPGVSAQLVSALQRVGNVVVIDYSSYERAPEKIVASLKPNERGLFIIKGAITEFSEIADGSGKGESTGYSVPLALIPYVGGLVSYGHGTKASSETKRKGMVGLDVQIIDPATGRLVTSFTTEGSFISVGATSSRTTWGNTKTSKEYASSTIGQAQRIALNKTVTQIHSALTSQ